MAGRMLYQRNRGQGGDCEVRPVASQVECSVGFETNVVSMKWGCSGVYEGMPIASQVAEVTVVATRD